jgi:EpsI family protein
MRSRALRSWAIAVALVAAAAVAAGLKPTHRLAEEGPRVDLERLIPGQFAGWRAGEGMTVVEARPDVQAKLDRLYDQVLSRTYVDGANRRVMLSIAYGGDQRNDRVQAHRPEYCYAAQGFAVRPVRDEALAVATGSLPVRRLVAQRQARHEPITYWITIGDRPLLPGLDRKLAQLRFGLTGTIPDGMLVRVSSLDGDAQAGYALQDEFIRALLGSLRADGRARLFGSPAQGVGAPGRV